MQYHIYVILTLQHCVSHDNSLQIINKKRTSDLNMQLTTEPRVLLFVLDLIFGAWCLRLFSTVLVWHNFTLATTQNGGEVSPVVSQYLRLVFVPHL